MHYEKWDKCRTILERQNGVNLLLIGDKEVYAVPR